MSVKYKAEWQNSETHLPPPNTKVEVMRPLSDWPQYIFGYWSNGDWFNMAGEEITVLKFRTLKSTK